MKFRTVCKTLMITTMFSIGVATSVSANAATVIFTGLRQNVNFLLPPGTGRCAPINTVSIAPGQLSSTGQSNLGDFASTQSHCIDGPPSAAFPNRTISEGVFDYAFAVGDNLFGTYFGTAIFNNGIVTGTEFLTVTGGTGRFANASGTFTSSGTLTFGLNNGLPVGNFNGTLLQGTLDLPAVPEPSTWMMAILGFGLVGAAMRRSRDTQGTALA